MAKLLSGKEVTASLNEEIRKKQNCSLHIISHQNSASSALVKEKMIFLTSAVRLNAVKLLAFPMKIPASGRCLRGNGFKYDRTGK